MIFRQTSFNDFLFFSRGTSLSFTGYNLYHNLSFHIYTHVNSCHNEDEPFLVTSILNQNSLMNADLLYSLVLTNDFICSSMWFRRILWYTIYAIYPTCATPTTQSLTDLIVTSKVNLVSKSGALPLGLSDHCLTYQTLRLNSERHPPKITQIRNFNNKDFRTDI